MPPKAKITRDMIIKAGLEAVRRDGAESLSVRRIAAELGCSTQPVMYHYRSVSQLRGDVYAAADELHTRYIMQPDESSDQPLLTIGLRYIRFAHEEKQLFRFLFQSGSIHGTDFGELLDPGGKNPVLAPLCRETGLSPEQAADVFCSLFICVHGAASLIADNSIEYDEAYFSRLLLKTFNGIMNTYDP